MQPAFAISIPVGAYHPLLRDCLKSLSVQGEKLQIALLDASNDDRVRALADEFNDLLDYRRHGPDEGQSDAIIEGWRHLEGDVLGWLNADDALYPGALNAAARILSADPQTDVVYGHSTIIDDDGRFTGYHWAVEPPSERLLFGDIISQPSCFFRRALYDRVGGLNVDLHYTMDWDLWVRFWRAGANFQFIDEVMSRVLWTEEAKTGGFGAGRRKELARIIDQNASLARRVKSRIGFGLHHFFEYVAPNNLSRALRRRLAPSSATIRGLGRNGEIVGKAVLPIVHYSDEPGKVIEIEFSKEATSIDVTTGQVSSHHSTKQVSLTLTMTDRWPSATVLVLEMANASDAGGDFQWAAVSQKGARRTSA